MAKYSKAAQKSVKGAMKKMEKGTLRSGGSGKKVTDKKQAIAIGLSEAKKKGAKVPAKKPLVKKAAASKSAVSKKLTTKKAAAKKVIASKPAVKKAAPPSNLVKEAGDTKKRASGLKKSKEHSESNFNSFFKDKENEKDEQKFSESNSIIPQPGGGGGINNMDQKVYDKATSKGVPNHNMAISSIPKGGRKPSGKKPLW